MINCLSEPASANMLHLAGSVKESIVDGLGIRYVLFAQGCFHNCPGCHNPETHSVEGGFLADPEMILNEIKANPILTGITLSGGEPFEQAPVFADLAQAVKSFGLDVWIYTGYTFETILALKDSRPGWNELLSQADVLVDGPFILEQMDPLLRFKGSKNQRILDLNRL